MDDMTYRSFAKWADSVLSQAIPVEVVAFNFNIAEASADFEIEVTGAGSYDESNPDWACDELFRASVEPFRIPYATSGRSWETALELVLSLVRSYCMIEKSLTAQTLQHSKAVTVGFVDGELVLAWPEGAE